MEIEIRDSAKDKISLKQQIEILKHQSLDVTNFEQNLEDFKNASEKSVDLASKKRTTAIQRIDKAIEVLQQAKDDLIQFEKHMETVGKKSEKVTAKKLTKKCSYCGKLDLGTADSEAS